MKVVLVNKEFYGGGAATACRRLLYALKKNSEIDVNILVQNINKKNTDVKSLYNGNYGKYRSLLNLAIEKAIFYFYEASKNIRFSFSAGWVGDDIVSQKIIREADIIHLHWINHGFISLQQVKKILQMDKPIVWTLHDMWPFTGGCHYAGTCENYLKNCGNCPMLKRKHNNDLSHRLFEKKKKLFNTGNITWVGCSEWMSNQVKNNGMLKNPKAVNIPNPIDTDVYKILNKTSCKQIFSFPTEKKVILFGAAKLSDKRKGMEYLINAINYLYKLRGNDFILATFGKSPLEVDLSVEIRNINYLYNETSIVQLYNAADLLVVPSLEDNLPNTIMEALSCGTPIVAFNVGGIPEMITHLENGYLAKFKDSIDLANGIQYIMNSTQYNQMQEASRNKALTEYTENIVAKKYVELYKSLM